MKSRAPALEQRRTSTCRPPLASHAPLLVLMWALMPMSGTSAVAQPLPDLVVRTTAGSVVGTVAGANVGATPEASTGASAGAPTPPQVLTFKGIPYAAPPVGPLRWRPPQPAPSWSGVRDATHFGADCMQTPYVISTGQKTSEDCLTLSVWTAARYRNARRPVMVFIYGGAFIGGSAAYPLYDGAKLAAEGVVVVGFNYRIGIFGFLAHPQLSAESPHKTSGNYGLLDQIAALQWVKANIAQFGGDPQRMTVFGESAGAVSIALLMTSPLAKGLFEQAILQSPVVLPWPELAAAERSGAAVGAKIDALRQLSAEQLLAHNDDFFPHATHNVMAMAFPSPIVDGYVLPVQPRRAFQSGTVNAVPSIVGINADEGRMFNDASHGVSVTAYQHWVQEKFGPLAPDILRVNPATTDSAAEAATSAIIGDVMFVESARLLAQGIARQQPRTFAYVFTRHAGDGPLPATHSEELPFVFASLEQPSFIKHPPPVAADLQLSSAMRRAWTRFAANGDPNGPGLPQWPRYDRATDPYLEFGTPIRAGHAYRKAQVDAIEPFYSDARQPSNYRR
jgi:para-nitrobenzyl esterase